MKHVYVIDALRTPQVKSGFDLKEVAAPFLGHYIMRHMMSKHQLPADGIDEVIIGNTGTPAKYPNVARVMALEAGLDKKTSAHSVHRNCASGMEALSGAMDKIVSGRCDLVFAGGVESMSQMPLLYNKEMTEFFIQLMKSKSTSAKVKTLLSFRFPYLNPVIAIEQGLTDPFCGKNMGQTAELLACEFGISRQVQDEFANESHHKAIRAIESGRFQDEILPISGGVKLDHLIEHDIGPRAQSSVENLAKLKPYFEKHTGTVTVGNSCPITDGGAVLLLASENAVKKHNLEPIARLVDYHFHGLEPERMGMGPLVSMNGLLQRTQNKVTDIDLFEINEAFAAQVLAVLEACKNPTYSSRWGVDPILGEIPMEKLNVNGGGIALGHPVGATGARLAVTIIHEMKKQKLKKGLCSLCIGGGQGGALLVETSL